MTTELWALAGSAALYWVILMIAATPQMIFKGVKWAASNRDEPGNELPVWAQRLNRARSNLAENLLIFAIFVLVVHVAGKANETSAAGALVFLGARVGHAVVYGLGIPYVRTAIWIVGVVGMLMVGSALL